KPHAGKLERTRALVDRMRSSPARTSLTPCPCPIPTIDKNNRELRERKRFFSSPPRISGVHSSRSDMAIQADNKAQKSGGDQGGRSKGSGKKEQGRESSGSRKSS